MSLYQSNLGSLVLRERPWLGERSLELASCFSLPKDNIEKAVGFDPDQLSAEQTALFDDGETIPAWLSYWLELTQTIRAWDKPLESRVLFSSRKPSLVLRFLYFQFFKLLM